MMGFQSTRATTTTGNEISLDLHIYAYAVVHFLGCVIQGRRVGPKKKEIRKRRSEFFYTKNREN